jgi:hypothetical protein
MKPETLVDLSRPGGVVWTRAAPDGPGTTWKV